MIFYPWTPWNMRCTLACVHLIIAFFFLSLLNSFLVFQATPFVISFFARLNVWLRILKHYSEWIIVSEIPRLIDKFPRSYFIIIMCLIFKKTCCFVHSTKTKQRAITHVRFKECRYLKSCCCMFLRRSQEFNPDHQRLRILTIS